MYYINVNYDFGIFNMAESTLLIFEKVSMETTRDNSNFHSGHIQVAFL